MALHPKEPLTLRVLSLNLHKARNPFSRKSTLPDIRSWLREAKPDLALLQEVIGEGDDSDWPNQLEFLADEFWHSFSYGKNAIADGYSHGNAILSRYPIEEWTNHDLSTNKLERRSLLHARIALPEHGVLHAFSCHLNLLRASRVKQMQGVRKILDNISGPCIVGGDFNDWAGDFERIFPVEANPDWTEVGITTQGKSFKTFPSYLPILPLDRLLGRHVKPKNATAPRFGTDNLLSDHLALISEFEIR